MSDLTPAEQAAAEALRPYIRNHRLTVTDEWIAGATAEAARAVVAAVTPIIAAEAIGDHETEHIVQFEETTFSVQHPLSERLDGSLFDCQVHADISALAGPPVPPGRYRAIRSGPGSYRFEPITTEEPTQ